LNLTRLVLVIAGLSLTACAPARLAGKAVALPVKAVVKTTKAVF
jgi:hypothetical protein